MKRVLIVDDSKFMRTMIKNIIVKLNGFEVVGEAGNGAEAIEKCKSLTPDIMTLDITMPDMNGMDVLKELKKRNQSVHVIMVTAMGQRTIAIEAIEEGAKDFIVKPFNESEVVNALNKC